MNLSHHHHTKGFTLIETLISLLIVGLAVTVATAALQSSLQTSDFVANQITARYLAEDAMEYVLALRDAGAATPQGWMNNLMQCVNTTDTVNNGGVLCTVDTYNHTLQTYGTFPVADLGTTSVTVLPGPIPSLDECSVSANGTTVNVFEQNTNCTKSKFTRTVSITPVQLLPGISSSDMNAYNEAVVTVKVSWGSGPFSSAESYTLSEDIYNWQPPQ